MPGDRVLVRNLSERGGPGKLRAYWEDQVHVVVAQKGEESPMYEVKPERGSGRSRILHRNMLLPCNALPLEEPLQNIVHKRKQRGRRRQKENSDAVEPSEDSESSDEEGYFWGHRHQQQQTTEPSPRAHRHQPQQTTEPASHPLAQPEMGRQPVAHSEGGTPSNEPPAQELDVEAEPETVPPTETADSSDQSDSPDSPQLRRSQRERRPREILTYENLGQPSSHVVELNSNPVYVNTLIPGYEQYSGLYLTPYVWGPQVMYPAFVSVGHH